MKMREWVMIKEALEAGVPGMKDVAALFTKENFRTGSVSKLLRVLPFYFPV
jgi:hypothetical protein